MKRVKITYEELQKWKATRYDNSFIKSILAKYLNVKTSDIDDYDQVNYGLTFEVWLVEEYEAQELSTGEVGERGVNYEIEKTKIVSCVNGFVTSGLMKINNIIIEDHHEQDCCEHVYADFSALEDTTFFDELKGKNLTAKEVANNIELVEGKGFRIFGYFVPCYNVQDGYYSSNLTLIITEEHGKNKIKIDLTNCTSWRGR
jgi:hypothetical protein